MKQLKMHILLIANFEKAAITPMQREKKKSTFLLSVA